MNKRGRLIVVSGPSGAGKGTILNEILKLPNYVYSVSATTRAPRKGEVHGKHYFFISEEEFEKRIAEKGFVTTAIITEPPSPLSRAIFPRGAT